MWAADSATSVGMHASGTLGPDLADELEAAALAAVRASIGLGELEELEEDYDEDEADDERDVERHLQPHSQRERAMSRPG